MLGLLLGACDQRPKPPEQPAVVEDDTTDTDLYHVDAQDTIIKVPATPEALRARPRAAPSIAGLPVGPTLYLPDKWCGGFVSGTIVSGQPDRIVATLKKADYCNMRIALTIPRALMTTNGETHGDFSPARARNTIDAMAAQLAKVPESARDNLLYISTLDDMGCKPCWGGTAISKETTAEHTRYARQTFPSWVPVGLRIDPGWMLGVSNWGVDVTTAAWHKKKGPKNLEGVPKQRAWYDGVQKAAQQLGIQRLIYTVNVHDCNGAGSPPCTPDELRQFGATALNTDSVRNCGMLAWRYDGVYFEKAPYQDAWKYLVNLGRGKPQKTCKA